MNPIFASQLSPCGAVCRASRHAYAFHRWAGWRRSDVAHYRTLTRHAEGFSKNIGGITLDRVQVWTDGLADFRELIGVSGGFEQPSPPREADYVGNQTPGPGPIGGTLMSDTMTISGGHTTDDAWDQGVGGDAVLNNGLALGQYLTMAYPALDPGALPATVVWDDSGTSAIVGTQSETEVVCAYIAVAYNLIDPVTHVVPVVGWCRVTFTWSDKFDMNDLRALLNGMLDGTGFATSSVNCGDDFFVVRDYHTGHPENMVKVDFTEQPLFADLAATGDKWNLSQVYHYSLPSVGLADAWEADRHSVTLRAHAFDKGMLFLNRDAGFQARHCAYMSSYLVRSRFSHGGDYVIRSNQGFTEGLFNVAPEPKQFGQFPFVAGEGGIDGDFGIAVIDWPVSNPDLPEWSDAEEHHRGDKRRYDGKPIICLRDHASDLIPVPIPSVYWVEMTWPFEIYLAEGYPPDAPWGNSWAAFWPVIDGISAATIQSHETLLDVGWYWEESFYGPAGWGATL